MSSIYWPQSGIGSFVIGQAMPGSIADGVLFVNSSGLLGQDANFLYDPLTQQLEVNRIGTSLSPLMPTIDLVNQQLIDFETGQVAFDWQNSILSWGGNVIFDAVNSKLNNSSGVLRYDFGQGKIYNNSNVLVIDTNSGILYTSAGVLAVDYNQRQLWNSGATQITVDWGNCILSDAHISLDWGNRVAYDASSKKSIQYDTSRVLYATDGTTATVQWPLGDIQTPGHFVSSTVPTIAAGTGAGTSPTISISGSDVGHLITLTTGSSPTANANYFTVTWGRTWNATPRVVFSPANANAAALTGAGAPFTTPGTISYTMKSTNALSASTVYSWYANALG